MRNFWRKPFSIFHFQMSARLIGGWLSAGTHSTLLLFVAEISNDKLVFIHSEIFQFFFYSFSNLLRFFPHSIRGRLSSMTMLARNIGVLIGYILGATVQYEYIPIISASIFIMFIILFIFQPNTPRYFIRKGQFQVSSLIGNKSYFPFITIPFCFSWIWSSKRAENSLKYYKGCKGKCALQNCAIHNEMERLKLVESEQKVQEKLRISDFCKIKTKTHKMKTCSMEMAIISFAANRCAMKGILIGITLVAISHSTGHYMLTTYAVMIFKIVDSPLLTPYMASILLAVALILGSLTTHLLADILGRRILIMTSLVGSAIGLFAMAIYDYLKLSNYNLSSFSYIPVMSLSFVIFISSAGIIPLSVLVCIENLSPKVRFYFVLSNVFYFFSKFLSQMFLQIVDSKHECGNHNIRIKCNLFRFLETLSTAFGIVAIVWMHVDLWDFMYSGNIFHINCSERNKRTVLGLCWIG